MNYRHMGVQLKQISRTLTKIQDEYNSFGCNFNLANLDCFSIIDVMQLFEGTFKQSGMKSPLQYIVRNSNCSYHARRTNEITNNYLQPHSNKINSVKIDYQKFSVGQKTGF